MKLYQNNGYVNIRGILDEGLPFNFVVGGRGTGKTFTALKIMIEDNKKFIYQRRTQSQCDLISKPDFSPFKSLNNMFGWNVGIKSISKYNGAFYNMTEDTKGELVPAGSPLGYTLALSTVSNMRGFDSSDVKYIIYDEFIPESHERPIKNEGAAFLNCYETINRNRELNGEKPLQILSLANSNNIANEIFIELRLVTIVEEMFTKGKEIYINRDRGIGIFLLNSSPISENKKQTALYKLTNNTDFSKMAVENKFESPSISLIKPQPLKEYRLLYTIGEISIYKHKSTNKYYCSQHKSGSGEEFGTSDIDRSRASNKYYYVNIAYLNRRIIFENLLCEILYQKLMLK